MTSSSREKGVFFFNEPTEFRLKSCSFFWKKILVFESFISDIRDSPELTSISKILFENDILKIVHTPEGLQSAISDKIYHGLDLDLRYLLRDHSERFVFDPKKPDDFDEIIDKSTKKDENDDILKQLIDQIVKLNIYQEWINPVVNNERFNFSKMPEEFKKGVLNKTLKIAEMQYEHYRSVTSQGGYGFQWRNQMLMEQIHASSALFVEYNWIPFYQYKLGDRRFIDAKRYLTSLDTIYPFLKKETIEAYSIDDIIKIRKNRRWDVAMERIANICDNSKLHYSNEDFKKEIYEGVMRDMLDYMGEEEVTITKLLRDLTKESLFTAIGFIPVLGDAVSAAAGLLDPITEYMTKRENQRTLPFFLNDLRKI
jgi:hypothetical protein